MSLDVYLTGPEIEEECVCSCCDNKHMRRHRPRLFQGNVTHNLGDMALAAGIYLQCWRPEEISITKASQLIPGLTEGLNRLLEQPERFQKFNPENHWGTYDGLVRFVREYLQACEANPDAEVSVCR